MSRASSQLHQYIRAKTYDILHPTPQLHFEVSYLWSHRSTVCII